MVKMNGGINNPIIMFYIFKRHFGAPFQCHRLVAPDALLTVSVLGLYQTIWHHQSVTPISSSSHTASRWHVDLSCTAACEAMRRSEEGLKHKQSICKPVVSLLYQCFTACLSLTTVLVDMFSDMIKIKELINMVWICRLNWTATEKNCKMVKNWTKTRRYVLSVAIMWV